MKRTAGEEFAAVYGMSRAANEKLAGMVKRRGNPTRSQSGGYPYDVCSRRTRSTVTVGTQEREPSPVGDARGAGQQLRTTPDSSALLQTFDILT